MHTWLPTITLNASSLCYAAGYLTGLAVYVAMARRRRLATSGIMAIMAAGLIGGLIGAHIGQWLTGEGDGKSVLGAIAGGYLGVMLYKRYLGIRRPTGDLFAFALSAGEAVGRWGCFFGGCCYGKPTTVPWGVWQHNAFRHPSQLYLSATNAAIFWILWKFERLSPPENAIFYLQGTLYCLARFIVEFFRETSIVAIGLSAAQLACMAGFVFFSVMFAAKMRSSAAYTSSMS